MDNGYGGTYYSRYLIYLIEDLFNSSNYINCNMFVGILFKFLQYPYKHVT